MAIEGLCTFIRRESGKPAKKPLRSRRQLAKFGTEPE